MKKSDVVLRDADGFNVNDGKTLHQGIEALLDWSPAPAWHLQASATQARHRYDFDRSAALGEQIRSGAYVDTAPQHIASARLGWRPQPSTNVELEWLHMGSYFMDAANTERYPGHDLLNLRLLSIADFDQHQLTHVAEALVDLIEGRLSEGYGQADEEECDE